MALALPLAGWAEAQLEAIRVLAGTPALAGLSGAQLLGERAALNGFAIPGRRSAGGGCRLYDAIDGQVALTLARADDRDLMPALFGDAGIESDSDIVTGFATAQTNAIVTQGRQLGLAIAAIDEVPASPACRVMMTGGPRPTRHEYSTAHDISRRGEGRTPSCPTRDA